MSVSVAPPLADLLGELMQAIPASRRGWVLAIMEQRLLRDGNLDGLREVRACRRQRDAGLRFERTGGLTGRP